MNSLVMLGTSAAYGLSVSLQLVNAEGTEVGSAVQLLDFDQSAPEGTIPLEPLAAMDAPPRLRAVARILGWPFKWLGLKGDPALPPATRALTALGPAYIKFGQVLSTRPDIVGDELADQLKYLQDKLPPFPMDEARAMIAAT